MRLALSDNSLAKVDITVSAIYWKQCSSVVQQIKSDFTFSSVEILQIIGVLSPYM